MFVLLEWQFTSTYPNDIAPPVWLFRLGCTPYAESIHVHSWMSLSALITLLSFIACFRNCSTRFSFNYSSTVLLVDLVHRSNIYGSMSGLPPFSTHSSFVTVECKASASCLSIFGELSLILCKPIFLVKILLHLDIRWIKRSSFLYNIS